MDYTGLVELADSSTDSDVLGLGTFSLKDNRDQKAYKVRRLADGNCWMAENLGLDLGSFVGTHQLTNVNTDLNSKTYWDPGESMYNVAKEIDPTVDPTDQTSYFPVASQEYIGTTQPQQFSTQANSAGPWGTYYYLENDEKIKGDSLRWSGNFTNVPRSFKPTSPSFANFSTYYNWYAATASDELTENNKHNAPDSICPLGWQLSTRSDGDTKSLLYLSSTYGNPIGSTFIDLPFSVFKHRMYYMDGWIDGTQEAWQWTSDSYDRNSGGYAYFKDDTVGIRSYVYVKTGGMNIRCVNKGSVREAVVATCDADHICYNGNGADSGTMTDQEVEASETPADTEAMLTAPTYTRNGYAFAGWTTTTTGYGETYGPNETITVGDLSQNGFQLYARWIKSSGTLQDFTAAQCTAMKEQEVIALTDNRDGKTYSVAKLKDDNCWMTSNLALNLADFTGKTPAQGMVLSTENTDLANATGGDARTDLSTYCPAYTNGTCPENDAERTGEKITYWDPSKNTFAMAETLYNANPTAYASVLSEGEAGVTKNNYFKIVSLNTLNVAQPHQYTVGINEISYKWRRVDAAESSADIPRGYYNGEKLYEGGYYNKYAGTAESVKYDDGVGYYGKDSICPKGWQLSDEGSTKSFAALAVAELNGQTGSSNEQLVRKLRELPLSFLLGGRPYDGSNPMFEYRTVGWYATGGHSRVVTIRETNYALYQSNSTWNYFGNNIRCVNRAE